MEVDHDVDTQCTAPYNTISRVYSLDPWTCITLFVVMRSARKEYNLSTPAPT
jgi:hypothetical protein